MTDQTLREEIAGIIGEFDQADDDADLWEYADRILAIPRIADALKLTVVKPLAELWSPASADSLKEGDIIHRPDGSTWVVGPSVKSRLGHSISTGTKRDE